METLGVQAIISATDKGYARAMQEAAMQAEQLERATEKSSSGITGQMTAANIASGVISKAFGAITSSVDAAISRVDTLNNFIPVMESLGYSSDDAQAALDRLQAGIDGLPTTLDGIVGSAQMLTASLNDIGKGADTAAALNDMFLAGGQGAEAASRALTQYNQILAKGKVDQQSWNTMVEVAPGQMKQLAQEIIGATATQKDLYDALQSGEVSLSEFNDAIIRLDSEGGASFASFSEQAHAATGGIGTAITNLHSAVTKGVANIIQAIDEAAQAAELPGISESLEMAKQGINNFFKAAAEVAKNITSAVAPALKFLGENIDNVVVAIGSVVAGMTALKVIDSVKSKIESFRSKIESIKKSFDDYNEVIKEYGSISKARDAAENSLKNAIEARNVADQAAKNVAQERQNVESAMLELDNARRAATIAGTSAEEAQLAIDQAQNGVIQAQDGLKKALTASTTAEAAAEEAEAAATRDADMAQKGLNASMEANPIGLIITAITAAISALSMLAAAFGGLTEEEKKARDEKQAFIDSANETAEAVHNAYQSIDEQKEKFRESTKQTSDLVDQLEQLSTVEKKSPADKKRLGAAVAQLNAQVDDLNLAYNAETGALGESIEAIRKKVEAHNRLKEAETVQDAYLQALEQQNKLEEDAIQLELDLQAAKEGTLATQKKEMEWTDLASSMMTGGTSEIVVALGTQVGAFGEVQEAIDSNAQALQENAELQDEYANKMAELAEQEAENARLEAEAVRQAQQEERDARYQTVQALAEQIVAKQQALEAALGTENLTLDMLTEKNQATVQKLQEVWQGYVDHATNMFDVLSDKQTLSVDQMIANIQENQRVIEQWGSNMDALRDRFAQLGLDAAVLDQLQDLGPEGAGYVAALVSASDEQLGALSESFGNGGEVAWEAMQKSMEDGAAANMDAVKGLITDVEDTLNQEVAAADWGQLSENIIDTMATALGKDEAVTRAAKQMATHMMDSTKLELGIASPSKVYKEFGQNTVEGMEEGVTNNESKAINASVKLAENMIKQTDQAICSNMNQPIASISKMADGIIKALESGLVKTYQIGVYAMQGFVNGMNSMVGQVMSVAASIANAASSTIQSALQIHSPSKVFMKLGEWTGEGFTIGLSSMIRPTVNAAKNLIDETIKTAELQTYRLMMTGSSQQFTSGAKTLVDNFEKSMSSGLENTATNLSKQVKTIFNNYQKRYDAEIEQIESKIDEISKLESQAAEIQDKEAQKARKAELNAQKEALKEQLNNTKDHLSNFKKLYNQFGDEIGKQLSASFKNASSSVYDALHEKLEAITKEMEDTISEINKNIDSMRSKLSDYGGLVSTETKNGSNQKVYKVNNLSQQIKTLKEYSQNLTELKGKVSDQLISEITAMDVDTAIGYTKELLAMSEEELDRYNKKYEEKLKLADSISKSFYAKSLNDAKVNYIDKMQEAFDNAADSIASFGQEAIQGFIKGMNSVDFDSAIEETANSIVSTMKKSLDIHSPSKVFRQLGEWTGEGFAMGLDKSEGILQKSVNAFSEIASGISIPNMSGIAEQSFRGEYSLATESLDAMNMELKGIRAEMADLKSAIQQRVMQVNTELQIDGRAVARATAQYTKDELNRLGKLSNNLGGVR